MIDARRTASFVAVAALAAVVSPPTALAHDPDVRVQPGALVQQNCSEVFAFPEVPVHRITDSGLVPEGYPVRADSDGDAALLVTTHRCEYVTVDGRTVLDAIDSYVAVPIDPPNPAPHGSFLVPGEHIDAEGSLLIPLEYYLVQWVTTSPGQAAWLREKSGVGSRVNVVGDIAYGSSGVFVPAPAPSPFRIDATVGEPGPLRWDPAVNLGADTGQGTVIIHGDHPYGADQRYGSAEGTITALEPGSPLGKLLGTGPVPMNSGPNVFFSTGFFGTAQWTQCVRNAESPCTAEQHPVDAPGSGASTPDRGCDALCRADLDRAKAASAKYQDASVALADGFVPLSPCEDGQGIHFAHPGRAGDGTLDVTEPEVLLYLPTTDGGLRLAGIEHFLPDADGRLDTDDDRPELYRHPFDGPMPGHAPGQPVHFDLHVWLWSEHPTGIFAQHNPTVHCPIDHEIG